MCPTANGPAGHKLEKPPNGPPAVEITSPDDAPDAGLRSLDHCRCLFSLYFAQVPLTITALVSTVARLWQPLSQPLLSTNTTRSNGPGLDIGQKTAGC